MSNESAPQIGFYLGNRVEVLEDLGGGWVRTRWLETGKSQDKEFRQWAEQIKTDAPEPAPRVVG